jgi:exopolysaccharide production protein ExoZ
MQKINNLQIVRGIASTSVVYFHVGNSPNFGAFGVDIFFVLSGFVIAMLVGRGESPVNFAVARLCRIAPLYWLLTIGLFVAASIVPSILNSATANLEQLTKSLFFIPFFRWNGDMYPLLGVGWTLNYEMLFYGCVFCSIIFYRTNWILATTLIFLFIYLLLGYSIENRLTNSFFGNNSIFEFLFGIYVFKVYESQKVRRLSYQFFLVIGIFAYVFMAIIESIDAISYRLVLLGIPSALLILSAVELERSSAAGMGKVRLMLASIGDASYATYLSHYFVVAVFERVLHLKLGWIDPNSTLGMLTVIASALLIGQSIYKYIDNPMYKFFKLRFTRTV